MERALLFTKLYFPLLGNLEPLRSIPEPILCGSDLPIICRIRYCKDFQTIPKTGRVIRTHIYLKKTRVLLHKRGWWLIHPSPLLELRGEAETRRLSQSPLVFPVQKRCTHWRGKKLPHPSFGRLVGVCIWLSCGLLFSCCTLRFSILWVIVIIHQECMLNWILVYTVLFRAGAMAGKYGALENVSKKIACAGKYCSNGLLYVHLCRECHCLGFNHQGSVLLTMMTGDWEQTPYLKTSVLWRSLTDQDLKLFVTNKLYTFWKWWGLAIQNSIWFLF